MSGPRIPRDNGPRRCHFCNRDLDALYELGRTSVGVGLGRRCPGCSIERARREIAEREAAATMRNRPLPEGVWVPSRGRRSYRPD